MTDLAFPPIGAYCLEKGCNGRRTVYQIKAIRGRVITQAGVMVAPSPTVTVENVTTHERTHMSLVQFHATFSTVVN